MEIHPIHDDRDLERALARIEALWTAEDDSPEADEIEVLSILVERYENRHHPMPASTPLEAIRFRMEQMGLSQRDLEPFIGPSGRVSEVLSGKRRLSLAMIRRLHKGLNIPYESLLDDDRAA